MAKQEKTPRGNYIKDITKTIPLTKRGNYIRDITKTIKYPLKDSTLVRNSSIPLAPTQFND